MDRRSFIAASVALPVGAAWSRTALAQARTYTPAPAGWRTFEITTQLEVASAGTGTRVWIPVPAIDTGWQQSLASTWSGNMREAALDTERVYGTKMVAGTWADDEKSPKIEWLSNSGLQITYTVNSGAPGTRKVTTKNTDVTKSVHVTFVARE